MEDYLEAHYIEMAQDFLDCATPLDSKTRYVASQDEEGGLFVLRIDVKLKERDEPVAKGQEIELSTT
jgi:hypothetical protein